MRQGEIHLKGLVILAAFGSLAFAMNAAAAPALNSYPAYLGGPAHPSYVASATTITLANAADVESVWTRSDIGTFNASPIEVGGVVYIGSENGTFYALNATTGATIWSRAFTIANCGGSGFVSSATVATEKGVLTVYVGAPDHYLYALKASNGATIWRHLIGKATADYYNWSSPTVSGGYVYYGVSTACDTNGVGNPGYDGVIALHQSSGKVAGQYFTGGCSTCLGASVHTSVAVDASGNVYVSTGNDNGTAGTDATAIVKLAKGTLARLGAYQVPGLYGKNSDFMASPTLFMNGSTPTVGACNKDGTFYTEPDAALVGSITTTGWTSVIGTPPTPDSLAFCGDAAVWNGSDLFIGGNNDPTVSSSAPGDVFELNPTTGDPVWQVPLPGTGAGPVVGGVSLDGSGVLAVPTYNQSAGAHSAVYLLNASNGSIMRTIMFSAPIFAQPVFADGELFIGGPTLQAFAP
jgi:polyvinyl alcohol dehydrogenase (cytochrome)